MIIDRPTSLNNRFILEKYTKEGLRADHSQKGFAMIAQKTSLKGLKLLVDCQTEKSLYRKGMTAFVKEEILHTAPWASKIWECPGIEGQFIIVDISHVEFVAP